MIWSGQKDGQEHARGSKNRRATDGARPRLSRVGLEGCAQPAHHGVAVLSGRVVLFGNNLGVVGFAELDRTYRARIVGTFACGKTLVRMGEPAGDRVSVAVFARLTP